MVIGKLGRSATSRVKSSDFHLSSLTDKRMLDPVPMDHSWTADVELPWLMNNKLGCCTITGIAHLMQNMAIANDARMPEFSDDDIVSAYSAATGYDPHDPSTDNGGMMVSALSVARRSGIGGHTIGAWVRVNMSDHREVEAAIYMFGGIYVGADLPARVNSQTIWSLPKQTEITADDAPGSFGGHAYIITEYDARMYGSRPWRHRVWQTMEHAKLYVDEAYAIIIKEWVTKERPAPNGFDIDRLIYNLKAL